MNRKTTVTDRLNTVLKRTRPYRSGTLDLRSITVWYGRLRSGTVGNGLERFGSEKLFYACGSCIYMSN
jgi:hypothetical protein